MCMLKFEIVGLGIWFMEGHVSQVCEVLSFMHRIAKDINKNKTIVVGQAGTIIKKV